MIFVGHSEVCTAGFVRLHREGWILSTSICQGGSQTRAVSEDAGAGAEAGLRRQSPPVYPPPIPPRATQTPPGSCNMGRARSLNHPVIKYPHLPATVYTPTNSRGPGLNVMRTSWCSGYPYVYTNNNGVQPMEDGPNPSYITKTCSKTSPLL